MLLWCTWLPNTPLPYFTQRFMMYVCDPVWRGCVTTPLAGQTGEIVYLNSHVVCVAALVPFILGLEQRLCVYIPNINYCPHRFFVTTLAALFFKVSGSRKTDACVTFFYRSIQSLSWLVKNNALLMTSVISILFHIDLLFFVYLLTMYRDVSILCFSFHLILFCLRML